VVELFDTPRGATRPLPDETHCLLVEDPPLGAGLPEPGADALERLARTQGPQAPAEGDPLVECVAPSKANGGVPSGGARRERRCWGPAGFERSERPPPSIFRTTTSPRVRRIAGDGAPRPWMPQGAEFKFDKELQFISHKVRRKIGHANKPRQGVFRAPLALPAMPVPPAARGWTLLHGARCREMLEIRLLGDRPTGPLPPTPPALDPPPTPRPSRAGPGRAAEWKSSPRVHFFLAIPFKKGISPLQ